MRSLFLGFVFEIIQHFIFIYKLTNCVNNYLYPKFYNVIAYRNVFFIMHAVVMCTLYFAFQMREFRAFSLSCLYDGFRPSTSQTTIDTFVSSLCFNVPSIRDPLYCADTVNLYKIRPTSLQTRLKRPFGKSNRKRPIPVECIWTYRFLFRKFKIYETTSCLAYSCAFTLLVWTHVMVSADGWFHCESFQNEI